MSATLTADKWDEIISLNDEFAKRASAREAADEQLQNNLKEIIPGVTEDLVKYACIDVTQKEATANILADHVKCVQFIRKLAMKVVGPEELGAPDQPIHKQANQHNRVETDPLSSPAAKALLEKSRSWGSGGN